LEKLKSRFIQHLRASWWVYLFLSACFMAGLVFGSLGVNALDEKQASSLREFMDKGLSRFAGSLDFSIATKQAGYKNFYNLGKIFVLGLTVVGFPFILAIIFTRGFVLGFTIVFLVREKSLQGLLLALLVIIPPNLLSLPAYILGSVAAINFSLYLLRGRSDHRAVSFTHYFAGYLLVMAGLSLLMLSAAFIEGYLSPLFIQLLSWRP
jgi:stage II sporulation protein M